MRLTLRLSPSLQLEPGHKLELTLPGKTLAECLAQIRQHYPEVAQTLWKGKQLNPQVLLFHNNTMIREKDLSNSVNSRDVLDVIPAIEGG